MPRPLPTALIVWTCDTCRLPVADGNGAVHCRDWEAVRQAAAIAKWNAHHAFPTLAQVLDMPDVAPWRVGHYTCVEDQDSIGYTWEVHRLRDLFGLLEFHFHVADKTWVEHGTNLNDFTRFVVEAYRAQIMRAA